ncbi:MAG: hypothetical protein AAF727_11710 [Pseudomonadota bacterium]
MTLRMHRPFIATIAALAIAITGFSAAPARAGDDEVAAALAVILGLAVVGTAINKRNDEKKARQQANTYKPRAQPRHTHVQPRPLPRRVSRHLLPQRCLFNLTTARGQNIQGFGQRCLSRHYGFSNSLPNECARRVHTRQGLGIAYGARCMSRNGYQLARR